jgi:hypothetical protein
MSGNAHRTSWAINAIQAQTPADKAVHLILDNYAAHKHPRVRWLNAIEGFFAKLTSRTLKRGARSDAPLTAPNALLGIE